MSDVLQELTEVWRTCEKAHRRLKRSSGYSVKHEVDRSVGCAYRESPPEDTAAGRLRDAYAYFRTESLLGGSRNGFCSRFRWESDEETRELWEAMRLSDFGTWRCRPADDGDGEMWVCEPVGLEGGERRCQIHRPGLGDELGRLRRHGGGADGECVVAGWLLARFLLEGPLVAFSCLIEADPARSLAAAADEQAWIEDGEFNRVEYERDVLMAANRPGSLEPGVGQLAFIPPAERRYFPGHFRESFFLHLERQGLEVDGSTYPWHVGLAKAVDEKDRANILEQFDAYRRDRGRVVARHGEDRLDLSKLDRLLPDDGLLVAMGVEPDGSVDPGNYPGPVPRIERLDRRARIRVRWVSLMNNFLENLKLYDDAYHLKELRPRYEDLIMAAHTVFGERITERPLSELLPSGSRQATRVCNLLVEAGKAEDPPRVGDLPENAYRLRRVKGIGEKSFELVESALLEALTGASGQPGS